MLNAKDEATVTLTSTLSGPKSAFTIFKEATDGLANSLICCFSRFVAVGSITIVRFTTAEGKPVIKDDMPAIYSFTCIISLCTAIPIKSSGYFSRIAFIPTAPLGQ